MTPRPAGTGRSTSPAETRHVPSASDKHARNLGTRIAAGSAARSSVSAEVPSRASSGFDSPNGMTPRYPEAVLWCLSLTLVFIVYETTLPFRFEFSWQQLVQGWERAEIIPFQGLSAGRIGRSDLVVNLLLFLPFGFFLALSQLFRGAGRWRPLLLVACGLATSAVVETFQVFSPARWPQTTDLISNALGTLLGVIVAWLGGGELFDRSAKWAAAKLRHQPLVLTAACLTTLILLGSLLPMDFGLSRQALAQQVKRIQWDPAAPLPGGWAVTALALIKHGWLFAFWGALNVFLLAGQRMAFLWVSGSAAVLAIVAEAGGIVVQSRTVSSLAAMVAWYGALLGAVAVLLWRCSGFSKRGLTVAVGLGYLSYLVADSLTPVAIAAAHSVLRPDGGLNTAQSGAIPWLPPVPQPTLVALGAGLARLIRFMPLGLALRFAVGNARSRYLATAMALAAVLGLELVVWHHTPSSGNLSELLLAWVGILMGGMAGERIVRYRTGAPASAVHAPACGTRAR